MKSEDEAAHGLVADAVVPELRAVLDAADLDADVSVREPHAPVLISHSESPADALARWARSREGVPTVVVDLSLGSAALLAQRLRDASRG